MDLFPVTEVISTASFEHCCVFVVSPAVPVHYSKALIYSQQWLHALVLPTKEKHLQTAKLICYLGAQTAGKPPAVYMKKGTGIYGYFMQNWDIFQSKASRTCHSADE